MQPRMDLPPKLLRSLPGPRRILAAVPLHVQARAGGATPRRAGAHVHAPLVRLAVERVGGGDEPGQSGDDALVEGRGGLNAGSECTVRAAGVGAGEHEWGGAAGLL